MRPPEFTGGNVRLDVLHGLPGCIASMRPPEFTGGNKIEYQTASLCQTCFNEAAGIHRRKPLNIALQAVYIPACFNEAAGIHRRKLGTLGRQPADHLLASMRPPEFTGGNEATLTAVDRSYELASMRPPEFTGGNLRAIDPTKN